MPYIERPGDDFAAPPDSVQVVEQPGTFGDWLEVPSPVGEISPTVWALLVLRHDKRLHEVRRSALWHTVIMQTWKAWDYSHLRDLEHLCPQCGAPHLRHKVNGDVCCLQCDYTGIFTLFLEAARRLKQLRGMWMTFSVPGRTLGAAEVNAKIMKQFYATPPDVILDQGDGLFVIIWNGGAPRSYMARITTLVELGFVIVDSWAIATDRQGIAVRWTE